MILKANPSVHDKNGNVDAQLRGTPRAVHNNRDTKGKLPTKVIADFQ